MAVQLKAEVRTDNRRSAMNMLRKSGRIPAAVYGKKLTSASIAIPEKEFLVLLRKNPHAVVDLDIPTIGKHPAMINEIQRDKTTGRILHVDFHQISMNEPVKAEVAVEITGDSAGVRAGGILQVLLHEVEVKCLPADLPAALPLDVTKLDIGENLLVSDLQVPAKVELLSDPEAVIVSLLAPVKAEDKEPAEGAAAETDAGETQKEEKAKAE